MFPYIRNITEPITLIINIKLLNYSVYKHLSYLFVDTLEKRHVDDHLTHYTDIYFI